MELKQRSLDFIREHFTPSTFIDLDIEWDKVKIIDLLKVQKFLKNHLDIVVSYKEEEMCFDKDQQGWTTYRFGRLWTVDESERNEPIKFSTIKYGDEDKCICCYGGFNRAGDRDHLKGIQLIEKQLSKINFKGTFIYRIGGWFPNRMKWADVPYSFKPFMIEECRNAGFTSVLWLDACCIPFKSLDPIFEHIKMHGLSYFTQGIMSPEWVTKLKYIPESMSLPHKEYYNAILSQVIGFDFNNKLSSEFFDKWIKACEDKVAFISPDGDQYSFAMLVNHYDLWHCEVPRKWMEEGHEDNLTPKNEDSLLLHQYAFLKP
jgi:hypothetical protein